MGHNSAGHSRGATMPIVLCGRAYANTCRYIQSPAIEISGPTRACDRTARTGNAGTLSFLDSPRSWPSKERRARPKGRFGAKRPADGGRIGVAARKRVAR